MGKNNKKESKKVPDPKGKATKTPQPEKQPEMTEEQAFMSYINQLISNTILDNDTIKTKAVDTIKGLGQQLGLYMREVSRLKEENEKLKKQLPQKKK